MLPKQRGRKLLTEITSVDYVVGPQNIQVIPNLLKEKSFEKVHIDFLSEEKFNSLTFHNLIKFKIDNYSRGL